MSAFDEIDILVNNAGEFPISDWTSATSDDWLELYNVNVVSMVRLIHHLLPQMKKHRWGGVIQISSVAAIIPSPANPDYAASKAAKVNLTVSLSKELAETGVTVNTVSPGPILTPGVRQMLMQIAENRRWCLEWNEIEQRAAKEVLPTLVGRFGRPQEVGQLVSFLASPLADFITGANIRIDGGCFGCVN